MSFSPVVGNPKPYYPDSNGDPYVGMRLFFYYADTSTKLDTQTDSTGLVDNTNPVVIGADGYPTGDVMIYGLNSQGYKVVAAPPGSDDPPTSPLWTINKIYPGVNVDGDEWINPVVAARSSATTFTVTDSSAYSVGQRFKATGGADRYGLIAKLNSAILVTVSNVTDSTGAVSTLHASMDTVYESILDGGATTGNTNSYEVESWETGTSILNYRYEPGNLLRYIPVEYHATILDKTITTDLATYIQTAWIDCLTGGIQLKIPKGRYPFTSLGSNTPVLSIAGEGHESVLYHMGDDGNPAIEMTIDGGGFGALNWRNFCLQDDGSSTSHGIKLIIDTSGYPQSIFDNVVVMNFNGAANTYGWYLSGIIECTFIRCDARNGRTGWYLADSCNDISLLSCNSRRNTEAQLILSQSSSINISGGNYANCVTEGNGGKGIQLGDTSGQPYGVIIKGIYSEKCDIAVDAYLVDALDMSGCRLSGWGNAAAGGTAGLGLRMGRMRQCNIGNNFFRDTLQAIQLGFDYSDGSGVRYPVQVQSGGISQLNCDLLIDYEATITGSYQVTYHHQPFTHVYRNAALSIANATWQAIEWDTVAKNQGFWSSGAKTRLTIDDGTTYPFLRKVEITANIRCPSGMNAGLMGLRITKNGAAFQGECWITRTGDATSYGGFNISSGPILVVPDDYFEIEFYQASGGAVSLAGGINSIWAKIQGVN